MKKGFTLVEIMIVVAIIAILAAVAIPNFIKYRKQSQMTACISNLKQIQAAIEQCKMRGVTPTGTETDTALYGTTGYIKVAPKCPTKNTYTYSIGDNDVPVCSTQETGYPHSIDASVTQ